jgi:hypothetical protein
MSLSLATIGQGLTFEARTMLITLGTFAAVGLYVGLAIGWMRFLDRRRGW